MTKARILADFISDGSSLADGTISVAEVSGAAPLASPTFTGTASGTFSGPLTGAVTGNVTGAVTGNVTGNLTGDVLGDLDLTAISATIADTAVDIFVYDTSKDSDGGAWRKRTQGTSWYNETLGTGTRGSRKEFPAVAVIVAEATQITIYDGDDPALPMWMVFNATGGEVFMRSNNTSCITMLNSQLVWGDAGYDLFSVTFIDEKCWLKGTGATYQNTNSGSIVNRNTAGSLIAIDGLVIVNRAVNDVAMTVLPNAPIDAATGLPVPTIAVATDGGVSVIKDDGAVVDITSTYKGANNISFNGSQLSYATQQSGSGTTFWRKVFIEVPSADTTAAYASSLAGVTSYDARGTVGNKPALNTNSNLADTTNNIVDSVHDKAFGFSNKLTLLNADKFSGANVPSLLDNSVAYITSDYNTGWMNGDIKLATLSDTDDTDVTGSELVTNGTFGSDVSGWAGETDTTATYDSGRLKVTKTVQSGPYGIARTDVTTVVGKQYLFQADSITGSGPSAFFRFNDGGLGAYTETEGTTHRAYFTATSTNTRVALGVASTAANAYIFWDNVSVQEVEEDRSVNGNGLQVFGTVTKNPVATGADLVAYSGFSGSNYLEQPYNADLQFGTGDFCFSFSHSPIPRADC
jgi:trimeric autotransporter adhesin